MANYKVVNADQLDADLSSVGDAIRRTGLTEDQFGFPDAFISGIDYVADIFRGLIERRNGLQIFFPKGLTAIGQYAFEQGGNMYYPNVFPEGIKSIGYYAFHNCSTINKVVLPASLEVLETWSFVTCKNLTKVTFKGIPTSIGAAFEQCPNLTTINVPWEEGGIRGAPWGATNATINYNYVEEG